MSVHLKIYSTWYFKHYARWNICYDMQVMQMSLCMYQWGAKLVLDDFFLAINTCFLCLYTLPRFGVEKK